MLDFAKLAPRIREMAAERARTMPRLEAASAFARQTLSDTAPFWEPIVGALDRARTSQLMARYLEPPDSRSPLPPVPAEHTVVAVDGSQIAPDRHEIVFCYLLNVGHVYLPYGGPERARLWSEPTLHAREEELYEESEGERRAVSPRRVATRRLQAECEAMEGLLHEAAARGRPALAMMDGTLILWALEAESPGVRREVLSSFEQMLNTARALRIPVAGYISRPGSSDVVNTLRASLCGLEAAACGLKCTSPRRIPEGAPCAPLGEMTDRALFDGFLKPGQRSAIFGSRSQILADLAEANRIRFFYLATEKEIARIELPAWTAEDPNLLNLAHGLIYSQAAKGHGYPRALTEAHEQAVVRGAERSAFFLFVERELARARAPIAVTRKALSKRTRGV